MAKEGDIVWLACRAGHGCEGNSAKIVFLFPTSLFSGRTTRYECQKCKKVFQITY